MAGFVAEPGPLPAPLAELKALLRIATGEEDALLAGLVRSAGELCEGFTGRLLVARPVEEIIAAATVWRRLAAAPVQAITEVAALAAGASAAPLPAEAYAIDIDAAGEGWVRLLAPIAEKRLKVRYVAGLGGDPNGVPEALRHGVLRLAAHLYAHRDPGSGSAGWGGAAPPAAVTALWRPWRRLRLS